MKTTAIRLAALAALATASPSPAQPAPAQAAALPSRVADAQALAGLDSEIERTLAQWRVPGVAVSVVRDGKVVLSKGYGVRNPDSRAPMTEHTIFPIASMSKAFTAFSVGLLADENRLSLDEPVGRAIPGLRFADGAASDQLTLRDMMSHRSGMPRHDALWYHNEALTREELARRVPHLAFSAPLRTRFQYNNIMFILSGLAVDKAAGMPWERFVEQRVFAPLAMRRTGFSPDRAAADPDHADGREVLNGKASTVRIFRNTAILNPAGGVYSTAHDLSNWMLVNLDGGRFGGRQLIQPKTLADLHSTHMPLGVSVRDPERVMIGYGLGWFTAMYRGREMVQHGGNLPGTSTLVALFPAEKLGITVLVNHGASELRDALTHAIADRFLGARGKDWLGEALARKQAAEEAEVAARADKGATAVAGTRPSHALADFAGSYRHPGYGALTITRRGDQLHARFNDDSSPLRHFHYDVFDATQDDPSNLLTDARVQFVMDSFGRISAAETVMEPAVDPVRFAREPDSRLSDPAYLDRLTGTYEVAGTKVIVTRSGTGLTMMAVGGSAAPLLPSLNGEFAHSRRKDARILFTLPPSGRATSYKLIDSSGVYEARRVAD